MPNTAHQNTINQRGNVLFFILIAIGLLGALTAMLTRSGGSSNETGDFEQLSIQASDILREAEGIRLAVQNLRQRGCSENQISFQWDEDGDGSFTDAESYRNTNAPSDLSCHIFTAEGGGVRHTAPKTAWLDSSQSAQTLYGEWYVADRVCVLDVGSGTSGCDSDSATSNEDMILYLPWIARELCLQINRTLGIDNPSGEPPSETGDGWPDGNQKYTGSFSDAVILDQSGKKALCFEGTGTNTPPNNSYAFYLTLLPR